MNLFEKPPLNELVESVFMKEVSQEESDIEHSEEDNYSVADEIFSYFGYKDELQDEEIIIHYGMPRRSGRYPYGSGDQPYQHSSDFLARVDELKKAKFTYKDPEDGKTYSGDNAIAKSMGLTTTEFRRQVSWAGYEKRLLQVETAKRLRDKEGMGPTEIGREMGLNESTVRSLLNPDSESRMQKAMNTVDLLREQVNSKGMIDVSGGVETSLGISKERLDLALDYLEKAEGYPIYKGGIPQFNAKGQQTNQKVLCKPGTQHKEIYEFDKVKTIDDYESQDMGDTYHKKFTYPESLDSKRMQIRYAEDVGPDGFKGVEKDGVIELRRGVEDLSLGDSRYSQVRILVDGTHYLKGMAVYSDNMPDGVDVIFNTNKPKGTPQGDVLKKIKADPDNPFGSAIKDADKGGQYWYTDKKTGKEKLGLINKRADEGDWDDWSNAIPSQFLGKQTLSLAKKQLDLAKKDKIAEFDEYMTITNPTIKKHMLEKFADGCDAAAVHLKAAALPGQKYHVIIPINTLKDNEVYAPNYANGTQLALIRYPHGGRFEIPILTVNNKNTLGNKIITKQSIDAVGINHKIAEQLSGADFDGDTVMCIPTNDPKGKVKIKNKLPLEELKGFDPKLEYGGKEVIGDDGEVHYYRNGKEYPKMKNTQTEMGVISNLITDMTLLGATDKELARAVKHSMVVIDAEKHKLDYKASYIENNIAALKDKYQPGFDKNGNPKSGGAATLLSRAKGQESVLKRQGSYRINMPDKEYFDSSRPIGAKIWNPTDDPYKAVKKKNPKTGLMELRTEDGKKITYDPKDKDSYDKFRPRKSIDPDTGETIFTDKSGKIRYLKEEKTERSTKMAETDDAYSLVSVKKNPMEILYADYANDMKKLANDARVAMLNSGKLEYNSNAKAVYKDEVKSLLNKIDNADLNRIKERQALRLANAEVQRKQNELKAKGEPPMKGEALRKVQTQAMNKYREQVGTKSRRERNIDITDKEWEAIQAGAISENRLNQLLNTVDMDDLRARATPKVTNSLSGAQVNRAKAMAASNYSLNDIAKKLGVSTSTVSKYLKGVK